MKKDFDTADDIRPEYDLSGLQVVARGPQRKVLTVTLAEDVAKVFNSEKSVNEALRGLIKLSGVAPATSSSKVARTSHKPKKSA